MPLPFILGAVGVGTALYTAADISEVCDTLKAAKDQHRRNLQKFERAKKAACEEMDVLCRLELEILHEIALWDIKTIRKIWHCPNFKDYKKENTSLTICNQYELYDSDILCGSSFLLSRLDHAAFGTASGVVSIGAAIVTAMLWRIIRRDASDVPLASLSSDFIDTTLAGSSLVANGERITPGIVLMIGGIIVHATNSKLPVNADEALQQMKQAEKEINSICAYLRDLKTAAINYTLSLKKVWEKYSEAFDYISYLVNTIQKTNWNAFSDEEKLAAENCVLLVRLLCKMCQVNFVNQSKSPNGMNTLNHSGINQALQDAECVLKDIESKTECVLIEDADNDEIDEYMLKWQRNLENFANKLEYFADSVESVLNEDAGEAETNEKIDSLMSLFWRNKQES